MLFTFIDESINFQMIYYLHESKLNSKTQCHVVINIRLKSINPIRKSHFIVFYCIKFTSHLNSFTFIYNERFFVVGWSPFAVFAFESKRHIKVPTTIQTLYPCFRLNFDKIDFNALIFGLLKFSYRNLWNTWKIGHFLIHFNWLNVHFQYIFGSIWNGDLIDWTQVI